ncbi:MAG: bifunctional phosphoribosylaminoimidazolecarboxamide formyltransferase/IMP cyclohydrolase [bacterium]
MIKVERALISVSNKKGIIEFAKALRSMNVEILSTGGTAKQLKDNGIPVRLVSEYTGFPEILDGRVKTLHPKVHGALLALRNNKEHMRQVRNHGIKLIDMVVVNLYPFEETVSKKGASHEDIIENIDIGGPTMLRSASKNYEQIAVVTDPGDYKNIINEMKEHSGRISSQTSFMLARKVFEKTSSYDRRIYQYFCQYGGAKEEEITLGEKVQITLEKVQNLRYGENPHQKAALYAEGAKRTKSTITGLTQLHGKELSFNNFLDLHANWEIVKEFSQTVAVIMKHNNPCGVAIDKKQVKAYKQALSCDPVSAFGSIVGFNKSVTKETALEINKTFVECIIAPGYSKDAIKILSKKKNIRLLEIALDKKMKEPGELDIKKVSGGMLIQDANTILFKGRLKVVTKKKPSSAQMKALKFAWAVIKHVKSNAILFANMDKTLGVGAGQMSRIDSVRIANMKMKQFNPSASRDKNLVMASDAFFPFRDGIDEAKKMGIKAIIQPGGSIRDQEIIDACNQHGIAMVFTGLRHFRH